jgi:hypothetical protein
MNFVIVDSLTVLQKLKSDNVLFIMTHILTPKQLLRPSEIWYRKCTKIHLRANKISNIFPGLYPWTTVKKGRSRGGRVGNWKEGELDRNGRGGAGRKGREVGRGGYLILTPLLVSDNSHTGYTYAVCSNPSLLNTFSNICILHIIVS